MTRRDWVHSGLPAGAYEALAKDLSGSRLWSLLLDVIPLVDGGAFGKLTSNRRAVFVASGLGTQLVPALFGRPMKTRTHEVDL